MDLNYLDSSDKTELDKAYQNGLKKLLKVLYSMPDFCLSISIPGIVMEYYSEKFPEALELLKELSDRSQIEILGGGFFVPILPLLLPSDRSGQIEKMTSFLRGTIGKRPRGISLFSNVWDNSLIQPLKACGFDYLFLDDSLVQASDSVYPLIASEYGKNIKVLVTHPALAPSQDETFASWKERAAAFEKKSAGSHEALTCISLDMDGALRLSEKKFISELFSAEEKIRVLPPMQYLKTCCSYERAFIPSGMKKIASGKKSYSSVHDYLFANPPSLHLYERMIYINMLISQSHGKDKMRKKAAQENLWEAQCGNFLISSSDEKSAGAKRRQSAYKLLNEAEKCLHESGQFLDALTSFDYNSDGFNEYVFQTENFNAVISQSGGKISDLNMLSNGANYTDASFSMPCSGMMVEGLSEKEPEKASLADGSLSWADVLFSEKKFDAKRKDVFLESESVFSQLKMPVSLEKKISMSPSGFIVQYILKNLSPFQLKGYFSVSASISQTDFVKKENQYELELIQDGSRIKPQKEKLCMKKGVSMLQITDKSGKMTMLFEPNEDAGFIAENENRAETIKFYWPVDLASGRAMEKRVTFMLIPFKKNRQ